MPHLTEQLISELDVIGKPFEWGGRGPNAFDCYGLVMHLFEQVNEQQIPDYRSPTDGAVIQALMGTEIATKWERSPMGAMLYIRLHGSAHVGYNLQDGRFLHVWERSGGVRIERIEEWQSKIIGAYNYVRVD